MLTPYHEKKFNWSHQRDNLPLASIVLNLLEQQPHLVQCDSHQSIEYQYLIGNTILILVR